MRRGLEAGGQIGRSRPGAYLTLNTLSAGAKNLLSRLKSLNTPGETPKAWADTGSPRPSTPTGMPTSEGRPLLKVSRSFKSESVMH
jgi:hypothetical protein